MKLRVADLFSGLGGFSLGLERTNGFVTASFCEIDPFCRRVLAKHWPGVPCHEDIRELKGSDLGPVDVICGGFPCQDISVAGAGAGLSGARSGLFYEIARLVGEVRPRYVLMENVSALLGRGLGDVLGELSSLGYDAEWHCIPASAVGAHHRRDRIWILAYAQRAEWRADPTSRRRVARAVRLPQGKESPGWLGSCGQDVANADRMRELQQEGRLCKIRRRPSDCGWWATEPDVGRVASRVPNRVDRLRALGNSVVPQVVEFIGRAILDAEAAAKERVA